MPFDMSNDDVMGREFAFSEADFKKVVTLVGEKTGISISPNKHNMVYSRLARRLRALKFATFKQYFAYLEDENNGRELTDFVNALTTNLTHFFREEHHFTHLAEYLKQLEATKPRAKRLRIWSAGCSTGMEPYSMAMTIQNAMESLTGWDAKILATDIDTNVLQTGRDGEYVAEAVEKMDPAYLKKYFKKVVGKETYTADSVLKRMITFKMLNLMEPFPMKGPFDAIFCRNVMIYFEKPTQDVLVKKFVEKLAPGGFLYIGHSETVRGLDDVLHSTGRTIYQKTGGM